MWFNWEDDIIPYNYKIQSIDGLEEVILNEPEVIYLIHDKNRYFKVTSRCCKEDTFDIQKGIEIAKVRAEIKQLENKLNNLIK